MIQGEVEYKEAPERLSAMLETVVDRKFRRFLGLFWPIFESFFGVSIRNVDTTPEKRLKNWLKRTLKSNEISINDSLLDEEVCERESLKLLVEAVEEYERKKGMSLELDPLEALRFRMEQMELSQEDLIPWIGSESEVSEVLSGRKSLSLSMIQKLHQRLGIPLKSLMS